MSPPSSAEVRGRDREYKLSVPSRDIPGRLRSLSSSASKRILNSTSLSHPTSHEPTDATRNTLFGKLAPVNPQILIRSGTASMPEPKHITTTPPSDGGARISLGVCPLGPSSDVTGGPLNVVLVSHNVVGPNGEINPDLQEDLSTVISHLGQDPWPLLDSQTRDRYRELMTSAGSSDPTDKRNELTKFDWEQYSRLHDKVVSEYIHAPESASSGNLFFSFLSPEEVSETLKTDPKYSSLDCRPGEAMFMWKEMEESRKSGLTFKSTEGLGEQDASDVPFSGPSIQSTLQHSSALPETGKGSLESWHEGLSNFHYGGDDGKISW